MVNIIQRSNYLIFMDGVRVDPYIINWQSGSALFADSAQASITLYRAPVLDKWKAYLTRIHIFAENPFTRKYTLIFEGEVTNRNWGESKSNSGTVTYSIKGFYHWLDIPVPLGITVEDQFTHIQKFIYEAQNINIDAVRELMISKAEALGLDKTIEEVIKMLFQQLTVGYYDAAEEETTFAFAKMENRFRVMDDVAEEFREAGFLDLFTFTKASNIQSFYVFLNEMLSQLMFEFYQDRDGSLRIKSPSWAEPVLKAHTIDASIIKGIKGSDNWEQEPTRVLAVGSNSQWLQGQNNVTTSNVAEDLTLPIALYIGNPRDPDSEMFYSKSINMKMDEYGTTGDGGEAMKYFGTGDWFDNISGQSITSEHYSKNPSRKNHLGIDLGWPVGTPVYNVGTYGVVRQIGFGNSATDGRGNYIIITQEIDGKTYEFQYMHFDKPPVVKQGDRVAPGQLIGYSGNTGRSTGPHLHFEIWRGKTYSGNSNALHPMEFLASVSAETEVYGPPPPPNLSNESNSVSQTSAQIVSEAPSAASLKAVGVNDFNPKKMGKWDVFHITAYTSKCAGCIGITKDGTDVSDQSKDHRVVAVDRTVIPLGSIVEIEGLGYFTASDIGGAIKGKRLDLLVRSNKDSSAWGRRNMRVRVLRSGTGNGRVKVMSPGPDFNTLITGSSASKYTELPNNLSLPKGGSYQHPDSKKTVDSLAVMNKSTSNTYATVDDARFTSTYDRIMKEQNTILEGYKKQQTTELVYPMTTFRYKIPSYAPPNIEEVLKDNSGRVDGNLLASIITNTSSWKENYNAGGMIGITGVPKSYAEDIAYDKDLFDAKVNVNVASEFLSIAMSQFNSKVTFALAAYKMGGLGELKSIVDEAGIMDFVALRDSGKIKQDVLQFVDSVLSDYLSLTKSGYIKGDPHKKTAASNSEADETELAPDFNENYRANLSDEERLYKVRLQRVEQALIRMDSSAVGTLDVAEQLIMKFAKYTMQLHRAKTHSMSVELSTCLPFLRLGYNVWIEPTRTDVVGYITAISHYGSFNQGCYTSINTGFTRRPDDYQEVDTSMFIGKVNATSEVFGETLTTDDMDTIREQLKKFHESEVNEEAHNIDVLSSLYSSMKGDTEYATDWNREFTRIEIEDKLKALFDAAPEIVKNRKAEVAEVIEKSKDFFIKKLLFRNTDKGM